MLSIGIECPVWNCSHLNTQCAADVLQAWKIDGGLGIRDRVLDLKCKRLRAGTPERKKGKGGRKFQKGTL